MVLKQKNLGAYYTPPTVVSSLVSWATDGSQNARVLDPSCGDGRFIDGLAQAVGIDVDPEAVATARSRTNGPSIIHADFFEWATTSASRFEAVVGNPPFIRYQRFAGTRRSRALEYCSSMGVSISGLTSSWAPFIVGAASLLENGGRLAFVVPAEISHAVYARPVLEFLLRSFEHVEILAIRDKLFEQLSEDCWLLRASGRGGSCATLTFRLADRFIGDKTEWMTQTIPTRDLARESYRLRSYLLPPHVRALYQDLKQSLHVRRIGEFASLGIGYVTGANDFFHLRPSEAKEYGIPESLLRPAVRSNRDLARSDITPDVVVNWRDEDRAILLLDLNGVDVLPSGVRRYLQTPAGEAARESYKCRNRNPWYCVPDIRVPDAFLSIMSTTGPRLVANSAGCVCSNSILALTLTDGIDASQLISVWKHPLTQLACEVEGHHLGGGMLKVEPVEARSIVVPLGGEALAGSHRPLLEDGIRRMREWRNVRGARSM